MSVLERELINRPTLATNKRKNNDISKVNRPESEFTPFFLVLLILC